LAGIVEDFDFTLLNDGSAIFLSSPECNLSIIDLVIASPSLALLNSYTYNDSGGSDHFSIVNKIVDKIEFGLKFTYI